MVSQKILICDDQKNLRESLKMILSHKSNLIIFEAEEGQKALEVLSENPDIELMLLDLNLPKIHGLELTRLIKSKNQKIKIIIITGAIDEESKETAYSLGVCGYIIKPFKLIEFFEVIDKNLN